jgi:hypothetical protein
LECDLTGWTLEMIPTDAPASAAARAARWPANPAPITKTSCCGIGARVYVSDAGTPARGDEPRCYRT